MKTKHAAIANLAGLILLVACDRAPAPTTAAAGTAPAKAQASPTAAPATPADADYLAGEAAWRKEQDASLRNPKESWLTMVGLHWVTPQTRTVGSAEGQDLRLALGA